MQAAAQTTDAVAGHLIQFNDNGAWSWFEDERAIVDPAAGKLLVSSIADASGAGGSSRNGNVELAHYDLATGERDVVVLKPNYEDDDHDSAGLWVRPDGRYLAVYAGHIKDVFSYYRISTRPGDPTHWSAEQGFDNQARATYSNLYYLEADRGGKGRLYNFTRTRNWDPNVNISHDHGQTWSYGGKLLTQGGGSDRPYVRYACDGKRIHFISTEEHPRDLRTSIYHGYIEDAVLYNSTGQVVDQNILDESGVSPTQLTPVFRDDTPVDEVPMQRAWTTEIVTDEAGHPHVIFTARAGGNDWDHRFFYARFDGERWRVHPLAAAGRFLYQAENDYTGLAALDPDDPSVCYISTTIDPRTAMATARYEVYRGKTDNGGKTWAWTAITERSSVDNIRPIMPRWSEGNTALLWLRGRYNTYRDWDLAVVGLIEQAGVKAGPIVYTDASPDNTRLADGGALVATGPSEEMGPDDRRWHRRTGFGNQGDVLTSREAGGEDAPALLTTTPQLPAGRYDVYAYFWANPNENWMIRAGLEGRGNMVFEQDACAQAGPARFEGDVVTTGKTVGMYEAYLGRVTVADGQTVAVTVDDVSAGQPSWGRTWFDGIGVARIMTP